MSLRPCRILHTSDIHLDDYLGAKGDESFAQQGLIDVVDKSLELDVDLFLLAGDLFDHNRVKNPCLEFATAQLARIQCPIVMITGNHDCLTDYSVYHRYEPELAGEHVCFIREKAGAVIEFPELGVKVWGKGIVDHHPENKPLETVPEKHQTLLFSATLPSNILRLAEKYLNKPSRISVGSTSTPIEKIKQEVLRVKDGDKYNQLIKEIYIRQGSILIFVKTRRNAEKMVKRLKYDDHDADAIHGNLRQNKRDRVIKAFRNNHFRILVGTDVASRGLDIPAIKHVINFDLPQVPEDFIHRIGRTARAGSEGSALSFVGNDDRGKWNAIQRLIDPNFKAEPGSEARGRKKRRGRSFDRKGKRGKNRFADKKSDFFDRRRDDRKPSRFKKRGDSDRRNETLNDRGERSFSFKKNFGNNKKSFNKSFGAKKKQFSRGKKKFRN